MERNNLTGRISPPKYKVGRFVLNEYELREMIARISEGDLDPEGIVVIDEIGNHVTFDSDGVGSQNLHGFGINSQFTLRKIRAIRLKEVLREFKNQE